VHEPQDEEHPYEIAEATYPDGEPVETLDRDQLRIVAIALEEAVMRGKVKPFEVLPIADLLGAPLAPWVRKQHEHYLATTPARSVPEVVVGDDEAEGLQ